MELLNTSGGVVATLANTLNNHAGWVFKKWSVYKYAGRSLNIYFGVYGDGDRHNYTQQYVDDVSLTGSGPAPTPTPTAKPTATPTAKPTATPTTNPTATPTAVPTATPTAVPTATPTAVPVACSTSSPDAGPFYNGAGYSLATGVADAFDYPVQHGCDGAGETVAVEITSPVQQTDINAYLAASGVTATGTITEMPVDGGGEFGGADSPGSDEASLDVETIIGLAPGATILVYNFPDLTDQSIEDGYNKTVSDNLASVTNSSFGGCETDDPPFNDATEMLAEQGSVKGITFVASSGDAGSDECGNGNNPPLPSSPSGGTHFVSVGGDNFTESSSGMLLTLTAQGDVAGTGFLSGGGVSSIVPEPSYQMNVPNVIKSGRNQPDVSLPGVGVAVYVGGETLGGDGTSWASPCFVALLVEATQIQGTRFGFVNPAIYSLFTSVGYADFTDVKVGAGTNGYYQTQNGYDQVTGIGAPKGYAFSQAI